VLGVLFMRVLFCDRHIQTLLEGRGRRGLSFVWRSSCGIISKIRVLHLKIKVYMKT